MNSQGGTEGEFTLKDGKSLYTKEWKAAKPDAPEASVVFLHGYSDHSNAYYELFARLASMGIEVFAFDQRGWGRSAIPKKQWGVSGGTSAIIRDVDEIIIYRLSHLKNLFTTPPLFLLGHSAGGSLDLTYAYLGAHRNAVAGYLVWAPFIALAPEHQPPWLKIFLGRLAGKVFPNRQLVHTTDPDLMSRDENVRDDFKKDKFVHDTGTLIGMSDMLDRGMNLLKKDVVERFDKEKPVMVMHGDNDMATDLAATKEFFRLLDVKDKELVLYEGGYHKLHCDEADTRAAFANDVATWILSRTRGNVSINSDSDHVTIKSDPNNLLKKTDSS